MKQKNEQLHKMRHSCAHIVAAAVQQLYPDAKFGVGPVIEDGFYYDIQTPEPIGEEELKKIQKLARKMIGKGLDFERKELPIDEAIAYFQEKNQDYKVNLLKDLKDHGTTKMSGDELQDVGETVDMVSTYTVGDFVDLCRGPHVENTKEIGAFKLIKLAGAYWRGDENNDQLQRIYGVCFVTKEELEEHLHMLEEAKKRDHRKLGKELDLFMFSNLVGPGMPIYKPKGNIVRNEIIKFSREMNTEIGFDEVHTPNMNKAELFQVSGHYDKYKDDMLEVKSHYTEEEYYLKPMNCPQHTQIFASDIRSYKDLPLRFSDFANLYRDEKPGELSGLTRLRCFSQDDGHIFCREDQIKEEFENVLAMIKKALETYGLDYSIRLSLRDPQEKEKYLGDDAVWDRAESLMRELLEENGIEYLAEEGEAAFYGPKMDIVAHDSLKRDWQISTIQLDFNMPERFELTYVDEAGEQQRPVMIHRALVGSPERFMAILIEHYAGAFPTWLAPVQVQFVPVSEKHVDGVRELVKEFQKAGIRIAIDEADETVGKKIRNAAKQKIPYMVVIGDNELGGADWTIRMHGQEEQETMGKDIFFERVVRDIRERKQTN